MFKDEKRSKPIDRCGRGKTRSRDVIDVLLAMSTGDSVEGCGALNACLELLHSLFRAVRMHAE